MLVLILILCCCSFDALWARQPDIDINRVKLLSNEASQPQHFTRQGRNSGGYQYKKSNDYTDYSSRLSQWSKTIQSLHDTTTSPVSKIDKVYQPREDPRLFYQSDSYIQENNRKNINRDVSAIYPGREVIRAGDANSRPMPLLLRDPISNGVKSGYNLCVRCPQDRTLIAKPGANRVILQSPKLFTCSGLKAPKEVYFTTIHGPKLGSLLEKGAHMIIGHILFRGKVLQICKMQIHVIVENCPVPDYLNSQCDHRSKLCSFSCRDLNLEMHGPNTLPCGDNVGWSGWTGKLPVCRARTWCVPPSLPDHGHLSCKGTTVDGAGFSEGSVCRIRCSQGWHWSPRASTVCRRGIWTHELYCQPKRNNRTKKY